MMSRQRCPHTTISRDPACFMRRPVSQKSPAGSRLGSRGFPAIAAGPDGTRGALRPGPAVHLCMLDDEGVVLVEERGSRFQRVVEESLQDIVALGAVDQPDARKDPARISIDDENRLVKRVEQYRVGGLRSDAPRGKKHFA